MNRVISPFALLCASVSAILGSGWLFSPYFTAQHAGSSSLVSWIIAAFFMIIIGFVFAEICAMIPISGSSSRIPHYTHGSIVSFVFAWIIWLSYMALPPTEIQSVLQYLNFYFPHLVESSGRLTTSGYGAATILMFLMSVINTYSLRWLMNCNTFLTLLKVTIPIIIGIAILMIYFSMDNLLYPSSSPFMPMGYQGVFSAISVGGIAYAFVGFKQAAELAGETKNPNKAIPFAIIGSIAICLCVFLLLQSAFLVSLTPENLANGWKNLSLAGNVSPLSAILAQDKMDAFLPILYVGAIISPLAAGLMYCSVAARSLYGMSKNGYLPPFFHHLTLGGSPLYAILTNFVVGMLMFLPLPGWENMVSFLTSLISVTYLAAPVCLMALRKQAPDYQRPFKLRQHVLWCHAAFYICTLMVYWNGWAILSKFGIAIAIGLALLAAYRITSKEAQATPLHFKSSLWMWFYFVGMLIISYAGHFGGGHELIAEPYDSLALLALSASTLRLSQHWKLSPEETESYLSKLNLHTAPKRV